MIQINCVLLCQMRTRDQRIAWNIYVSVFNSVNYFYFRVHKIRLVKFSRETRVENRRTFCIKTDAKFTCAKVRALVTEWRD